LYEGFDLEHPFLASFLPSLGPMIGENRQLIPNEPVEVQDYKKNTCHFKGILRIDSTLIKESRKLRSCNRLDLQTHGSQPVMPKNLPDHCFGRLVSHIPPSPQLQRAATNRSLGHMTHEHGVYEHGDACADIFTLPPPAPFHF